MCLRSVISRALYPKTHTFVNFDFVAHLAYIKSSYTVLESRSETVKSYYVFGAENAAIENPHFTLVGDAAEDVGKVDKLRIAKGIAKLEEKVWGEIAPHFIQGTFSFAQTIFSRNDIIVGVSYAKGSDVFGPYLSYFAAYENPNPQHSEWADLYESYTGKSFSSFMRNLPSYNPRFFVREDQTRDNTPLAKAEHRELMDELYDYMEEEGIAFGTYARAKATYQLMLSGKQGRMVIVAERYIPNFFGPNDDCVQLVGYYVPKGEYREGMIESTRI